MRAPGRISKANHEAIDNAFEEVLAIAERVSTSTGLTPGQVFDQWMATRTRKHVMNNMWNVYSQYYTTNLATEHARLSSGMYEPLCKPMQTADVLTWE